jgi:hypothetical protein
MTKSLNTEEVLKNQNTNLSTGLNGNYIQVDQAALTGESLWCPTKKA